MVFEPTAVAIVLALLMLGAMVATFALVLVLHWRNRTWENHRSALFVRWRPIVADFIYAEGSAKALCKASASAPDYFLEYLVHLATMLRGAAFQRVQDAVVESGMADYLENSLQSHKPWKVSKAAHALFTLRIGIGRGRLRRLLRSPSEGVVFSSALALSRIGQDEDLPLLLEVLSEFSVTNQDLVSVVLLGYASDHPTTLLQYVKEHSVADPALRSILYEIFGKLNLQGSVHLLREELRSPSCDECYLKAIRALGEMSAVEALEQLRPVLNSSDWRARALAVWSVGRLKNFDDVPALSQRLYDESWAVRLNAATALLLMEEPGREALEEATLGPTFAGDIARHALQYEEKAIPVM
ncbi:MAG: HEAT repeat domain-containing protein [Candidatus Sumerlaeaceae bacterium]